MAPFSTCSRCHARTRKLVKDPLTSKMIYICPKCFRSKECKDYLKNVKALEENRLDTIDKPKENTRGKKTVEIEKPKVLVQKNAKKDDKRGTPKKIETQKVLRGRNVQKEEKGKDPVSKPKDEKENIRKEEPAKPEKLIAPGKPKRNIKTRTKITPPVMQNVVINGKKYIAISETADDD
ncbi:uncharacterized protein DDB_G0284459 [Drosophila bipectinata]|uniref:uncharacterized protein DDB_G0284459 n=1 Tax=Drosophila bipectinata TaxID=42026 RepID=UPI001C8A80E9|nr:uncharacterized protein LOC108129454 [Drosophila bipectinata]